MVLGLGGALCIVGTMLPWLGVDGSARSSYELAAVVDRLGLADGSAGGVLLRIWPSVPVVVAASAVLAVVARDAAARLVALVAGFMVMVGCALAWSAPLQAQYGIACSLAGAVVLLAGASVPRRLLR